MSLEFFTSQQGFQKPLLDQANSKNSGYNSNRDFTTSLKKNEFNTSRSNNNDLRQSDKNDKFAEMMNSLKKKEAIKNKDETEKETGEIRTKISRAETNKSLFQTEETALAFNAIEPKATDLQKTSISLTDITALNAEIQKLIEAQNQAAETGEQIVITDDTSTKEIEGLLSLIASFLETQDQDADLSSDSELASLLAKMEEIVNSDEAQLIALPLNPEQLTELQELVQQHLKDEVVVQDQEALAALAASFTPLQAPVKQTTTKSEKDTVLQAVTEQNIKPEHYSQSRYDTKYDSRYDAAPRTNGEVAPSDDGITESTDFKSVLKNSDLTSKVAQNDNNQSAGQKFLQNTNLIHSGQSGIELTTGQNANAALQTIQSVQQNSATNVITQSQNATQTHPATQMVSATIQKAVKAGEETNIKLRLDPPELGRVEVKMSIDKDNVTKIVLTVEKTETYLLLKHDAQALQDAMQNAGLNSEGNLEFDLASDNHDFNQNNNEQNGNNAKNHAQDEELIETTMDWQVDPKTGRMHYNVLV